MEQVTVVVLITIFVLMFCVDMWLNKFIDPDKTGKLKHRGILLHGPMVPEEILTAKGLKIAKLRNGLIVTWLVLLVTAGIVLRLRQV